MVLCLLPGRRKPRRRLGLDGRQVPRIFLLLLLLLIVVLMVVTVVLVVSSGIAPEPPRTPQLSWHESTNRSSSSGSPLDSGAGAAQMKKSASLWAPVTRQAAASPFPNFVFPKGKDNSTQKSDSGGPYHNREVFTADYEDMLRNLKIYVYPDVEDPSSPFPNVFHPVPEPGHPKLKLGNYFSEHAFKSALVRSSLLTLRPEEAQLFFMPFSINAMRSDHRLHSEASISEFVSNYTSKIGSQFRFWNASRGADHFYVCCHSVGRDAASKHRDLHNNAIQVTCSSSYFQRLYITHKDVALPQVWPRLHEPNLNPPDARNRLVFFVGRKQNSRIRERLLSSWGNDTTMDIFSGNLSFPYEEGFRRSRYCLHVKGYEVNTARISDAIHYGCIPVIISDHYDLPLANVLDWSKFSIIVSQDDVDSLKDILLSVSRQMYLTLYQNLCLVRRHFSWHIPPQRYDSFFMTAYQLWLKRGLHRLHD